jgi:Beta-propeller repeat
METLMRSAILVPALILPLCLFADEKAGTSTDVWGLKSGLSFEPNSGQTDPAVQYLARTAAGVVFFTDRHLVLHRQGGRQAVRLQLLGSDPQARWEPADATGATTSYYIGRDPKNWAADVPRYRRLFRRGVYRGVDQVYYGNADRLEYDFLLAPHADPARIRMRVDGATGISVAADGTLVIETPDGKIEQRKPILYETLQDGSKRPIQGGFRLLSKDTVAFVVAKHDRNLALSIDPVLESSTYLGGSFDDRVVATNGSTTVGTTNSIDFPGATFSRRQGVDIFVSGFFGFQQSTMVIGGSGDDQVTSATFGGGQGFNPSIVIGGYTNSKDLPTNLTQNTATGLGQIVWQTDFAGGSTDGFLLVFTLSGSRIGTFLTYVGTPGDDRVTAVATTADLFVVAGSTNGSGLPTSAFSLPPPFQFVPAGGIDGFFLTGSLSGTSVASNGFVYNGPSITAASYFGGSGDDIPLAAVIGPVKTLNPLTFDFYLAGETRSPDFPLVNSLFQRSGDSDAFLMHFSLVGSIVTLPGSTLFGGSGFDLGVGLALFGNSNVALAGVTSSADLPVQNPAQGSYGGGASDAFVAQFTPDLSQLTSSTYFGGAAADEATSIAADSFGNIFVAGWTASQDLPVQNALQPNFAGGPDDGFLLHFDIDGTVHQATYFGGSGSDRILGLVAPGGPTVWAGGQTTSPDLPLKNPTQDVFKGPSDGFAARISTNLLDLAPIADGKDLRTYVSFGAGMAPPFATPLLQVTITSSDPSKVLVAAIQSEIGQASVQAPLTSSGYFYVDCLVDQGGADVTLSSPGYVSRKVRANCFAPSVGLSVAANPLRIQLWAQSISVYPYVFVTDPTLATPVVISYTRPGADSISAQITSSSPSVVTVSPSTVKVPGDGISFVPLSFQTVGVGETDLQIASASAKPSPFDHVHVIVGPPLSIAPDLPIPAGFQTRLPFSYGRPPDPNATITITSLDPSKVALSLDPSQPGSGTVSFPAGIGATFNNTAYVQALASDGDVPITLSVAGIDGVSTMTAHLSPPVAVLVPQFALTLPLPLVVGGTSSVNAGIGMPGSNRLFFGQPNPGSPPLRFSLDSSSPSVVALTVGSMDVPANFSSVTFVVRGIADGTANLNLHPPDGVPLSDAYAPVSVVVKTKPVVMSDLELGKDLAGFMTLSRSLPHPLWVSN